MTSTDCFPWWHTMFDGVSDTIIDSGCPIGGNGNATCDPETMRANTEAQFGDSVSLEEYSLARYVQSEVGTRSIEESVAVAEAAVNRAALEGSGINDVLLYRQGSGQGFYGPIHGLGTGTSTAPYGRWASTSQDPSIKALLVAKLVASGQSDNFSNYADDQDGPEAWVGQGQQALNNYVAGLANRGKYWVGPLPGIDPWRTFLQFTPGISPSTSEGQTLIQRGQAALALPATRSTWDVPVCNKPILLSVFGSSWKMIGLGVIGLVAGIWISHRKANDLPFLPW